MTDFFSSFVSFTLYLFSIWVICKQEIERLNPDRVIIIGGTGSVSSHIENNELPAMGIQDIERIAGATRYDTPPIIGERVLSHLNPNTVPSVFIASGENFEDSLSVASAAADMSFPILLVKSDSIPEATKNFLQKYDLGTIYVVGKQNSISDSVVEELKNYGPVEDKRGTTRYQAHTNVLYDLKLKPTSVTVAHGWTFQGMLASGTLAALTNSATLITNSQSLSDDVKYYLLNIQDELDYAYIIGGTDTLSTSVENEVDSYIKP
ncbi:MAG: cell wall-binding repeat-containing protein [Firmicutes bacterium]|nr:cell wall-binding repeat-containing protein [Bacillota bacterium]